MKCPVCGNQEVGCIGTERFYCWNCFVEYNARNEVFRIEEDGSLTACHNQPHTIGSSVE
ncbi:hypothetical protein [Calderihabitans maritimus]|uniref:Uncharacterized protein n=1 Tax=Calderihabitans maritimus TaxID=1246530 RepID=A0A1Z5HTL3_9FIRM|nr:hypothetical protein [Calderihabitans maritimus]GAW92671.1 hypothetical protein HM1_1868 [Calderihabitans maritimus]